MTRMYENFDLDAASRNRIDYGTAAALFPRLAS
jgi:hypothetical protein